MLTRTGGERGAKPSLTARCEHNSSVHRTQSVKSEKFVLSLKAILCDIVLVDALGCQTHIVEGRDGQPSQQTRRPLDKPNDLHQKVGTFGL